MALVAGLRSTRYAACAEGRGRGQLWERIRHSSMFDCMVTCRMPARRKYAWRAQQLEPLDIAEPGARVRALVRVIPRRRVTTYRELCKMIGEKVASHARTIPDHLTETTCQAIESARHRVLDSCRRVPRPSRKPKVGDRQPHMTEQPELLSKELGIDLVSEEGWRTKRVPESWMWRPTHAQLFLRPEGTATPWPMPPPKIQT